MPQFKFVLKETPMGKAHHDDPPPNGHLDRRNTATAKAELLSTHLTQPVGEQMIFGDWYYTWVVDSPDINVVWALLGEFTHWGFVELFSGPTSVFAAEELSEIQSLSVKLRSAFPHH